MVPVSGAHAAAGDNKVGGTGTILPRGGIIRVTGVPGYMITKIVVQPGQTVAAGAPLFQLDSAVADVNAQTAANDLETLRKDNELRLTVEAMTVKLLEARLAHAKRDAQNYRAVGPGGTSEKELSRLQQAVEEGQLNLDMEKARAVQLQADLANAERNAVIRRDSTADASSRFTVRAPSAGTVLKIDRHEGEQTDGETVIEFGDLSAMYVEAQIYQGDMVKVKPGMKVTVKNSAFPNLATGKVENIGRLIGTRSQLGDVMIRLDKNDPADLLVGMEVEVVLGQ